jgi:ketosteroid isomerase-like protein
MALSRFVPIGAAINGARTDRKKQQLDFPDGWIVKPTDCMRPMGCLRTRNETRRITAVRFFTSSLFDRRIFLAIPWTRMPDSALASLCPAWPRPLPAVRAATVALLLTALSLPAFAGFAQHEDNRHQIDKLEDAWKNAVLASDTKAMDALLAPDYIAITPSGTLQSREEALATMRADHFTTLDISDRKVRFYGSTAIVTSQANIEATTPDGSVSGHYWYTRVYARNPQGQWRIVSFEASRVREPGPHKRNELH